MLRVDIFDPLQSSTQTRGFTIRAMLTFSPFNADLPLANRDSVENKSSCRWSAPAMFKRTYTSFLFNDQRHFNPASTKNDLPLRPHEICHSLKEDLSASQCSQFASSDIAEHTT